LPKTGQIVLRAEVGELERLRGWLEELSRSFQLPERVMFQLDLCLTEWVTNVIDYAYPAGQAPDDAIVLELVRETAAVLVQIADHGVPFDPVAYVPKAAAQTLEEADAGGRGLLLVRKFATHLHYRREQGSNRFSLRFSAPPDGVC
jgi:anti-sigma regulatory factor (Ser/Thr protein kinase)